MFRKQQLKVSNYFNGAARTILCWLALVAAFSIAIPSSSTFAQKIYGAIEQKWKELKAGSGPLGAPTTDEQDAARGGRFNEFQNGFIYWHPKTGAYAVYGLIGKKWNQLGRERGFGYPITDERPANNGGRYNDFDNGGSIYWHRDTGAFAVYGDIRKKWESFGRERGCLGYPTSDEFTEGKYRRSNFQGGYILWTAQRGAERHGCVELANPELRPVREPE